MGTARRAIPTASLLLLALLISNRAFLHAESADAPEAVNEMVQSEINFSKTAGEKGIKESFLQFFADNSVIFGTGPENGKKHYTDYQEKGFNLRWQPVFAAIAGSGEIGMTTGPWEFRKTAGDQTPLGYGQFFSIWKRQPDTSWKVLFDTGTENPKPTSTPGKPEIIPLVKPENVDPGKLKSALETAEKDFAKALSANAGEAILSFASDKIHVLREEAFPAAGQAAAQELLSKDKTGVRREMLGGAMSNSSDFAYRYGSYTSDRSGIVEKGHYVMVWCAEPGGQWKILADLQKKAPEEKK